MLILLAHFTQRRLGIVKSKGLTWISIEIDLNYQGRQELCPLIGEVVNSAGVNGLGHKVANRLLQFLRQGLYQKGAHNMHTRGEGSQEGDNNQAKLFLKKYYNLPFYFITNYYLLLACFSVGFLYTIVQNIIFLILTHNPKNSVENVYILVQKGQNGSNCTSQKYWARVNDHISPLW